MYLYLYSNVSLFAFLSIHLLSVYLCGRLPVEECSSDTDGNVYEQPRMSGRRTRGKSRSALSNGSRRPDKAIYVPRALRHSDCETSLSSSSCSLGLSVSEESGSDNTDPPPANHGPETDSTDESVGEQDATAHGPRVEPVDCEQTLSYFMAMSLEEAKSSKESSQTCTSCKNTEETDDYYHEVQSQIRTVPFYGRDPKTSTTVSDLQSPRVSAHLQFQEITSHGND